MIKIYHNPRCTKSRQGVALLEENNIEFETVKYLDNLFTVEELTEIISFLNIKPIELVRKNEKIWKENFKGNKLADNQLIKVLVENPKLIERPIVVNGKKATIGRPTENILNIL